jgi:spermidine synthase
MSALSDAAALAPALHVKPYVHDSPTGRALHFAISEVQSRMDLSDPVALVLAYTRTMMGFLLLKRAPRQITMVGLGGGSLAKFCHQHLPDAHIEVVEINPHVIALRDEFQIPADSARFAVIHGDGARFVRDRASPCDVLIVDGFTSDGMPRRLSSQRFYDDCQALLQPGGVLVVNLHYGHRLYSRHVDRIHRSFEGEVLVVDDGGLSNSIVFACKGPLLDQAASGATRRPQALTAAAAKPLLGALALVTQALKDRRGA